MTTSTSSGAKPAAPAPPRAGRVARGSDARCRCRRCRELRDSLLPAPLSISTSASGVSTSRQRMASGMRLRSSAGMRRSQSGFGTTPNMAPPSSRCVPASSAWMRRSPSCASARAASLISDPPARTAAGSPPLAPLRRRRSSCCSSPQRVTSCSSSAVEQPAEHSAVATASPHARCRASFGMLKNQDSESSDRLRSSGTTLRASRTVHSVRPVSGTPGAVQLRADEAPVERGVVRDEHGAAQHARDVGATSRSAARRAPSPT
jgi:hypothetical protein